MYYVYCLKNNNSNKRYYGYSNLDPLHPSMDDLMNLAKNNKDLRHLYNSMNKYGTSAFSITVVDSYSSREYAEESCKYHIDLMDTDISSAGYNCKDAQLIPCVEVEGLAEQPAEDKPCCEEEEKDLLDVATAAISSLTIMRKAYKESDFEHFMAEYQYFNSIIPITGVYENFNLSMTSIMNQLLLICKDALGVYIKEHKIV